jgi:hypothetical protein
MSTTDLTDLTDAQRELLDRIRAHPGMNVPPRLAVTRDALMNRMLIEWSKRDYGDMAVQVAPADHVHVWESVLHLEGCHWYRNTYKCECGAMTSTQGERGGLSMMLDPGMCSRCDELARGARRKNTHTETWAA